MIRSKFVRWCLLGFLTLTIFRVFPPGSPQPADLLVMAAIAVFLRRGWIHYSGGEKFLVLLTVYTYVVNLFWGGVLGTFSLMVAPLYFTYNLLAYAVFRRYFQDERNLDAVLTSVLLALTLETFFTLTRNGDIRATGTFDNPNALAYFAICYTSIALYLADRLKRPFWVHALALVLGWTINLFALSKAGMGGMVFMTLIIVIRRHPVYVMTGGAAAAAAIYFVFLDQIQLALERMGEIGQDSDDSLAGRGYDRIVNEIEHTLLGAGEGEYWRHDSIWRGEIHSTFGTLLFCYGIFGLGLFLLFLFYLYRTNRLNFLLYLLPIFVYSFTHNGLRSTPFWILLALLASARRTRRSQPAQAGQPALLRPQGLR